MSTDNTPKIYWTKVDEAPSLATYSLLPIVQAYAGAAGIAVETRDISLAGRILAQFPDRLSDEQRVEDDLAFLGELRPSQKRTSSSCPTSALPSPSSRP